MEKKKMDSLTKVMNNFGDTMLMLLGFGGLVQKLTTNKEDVVKTTQAPTDKNYGTSLQMK